MIVVPHDYTLPDWFIDNRHAGPVLVLMKVETVGTLTEPDSLHDSYIFSFSCNLLYLPLTASISNFPLDSRCNKNVM